MYLIYTSEDVEELLTSTVGYLLQFFSDIPLKGVLYPCNKNKQFTEFLTVVSSIFFLLFHRSKIFHKHIFFNST